jgi:hypothetical protein
VRNDDFEEEVKPPANDMPLVSAGLLLLAGIGTIVLFMIATGRFPKSWILATAVIEIVAAVLLVAVRSSLAAWLVIIVALGLAGYHAYDGWQAWQISQYHPPVFGRYRGVDPDPETRAALAGMSRAAKIHLGTDVGTALLDLTVFVLLVGTRKGRAVLWAE